MMRVILLAAALSATTTAPTIAADPLVTANSIVRTYADYCDPRAHPADQDSDWDPVIAQNYARVLTTKYLSNCDRFLTSDVLAAMAVPRILREVPALGENAPRTLTQPQAMVLGGAKRLREHWESGCSSDNGQGQDWTEFISTVELWGGQLSSADLWDYAAGYTGFDIFARQLARLPLTGDVAQPCDYAAFVPLALGQYAINSGLKPQLDAMTKAHREFDLAGATSSISQTKGAVEETENSVWEPGDTNARSGIDEKAFDLAPYVPPADAIAIANFAGRWSTSCPGGMAEDYMIGQFNLGDPVKHGIGVPRILSSTLSCEIGRFRDIENGTSFTGLCHRNGTAWQGTGSIVWFTDENIRLYLFDDLIPITLMGCDLPPVAGDEPTDIGFGN